MKLRYSRVGILFYLLVALFFLAGCSGGGTEVGNPSAGTLSFGFADDRELENYLKEQFAGNVINLSALQDGVSDPATGSESPADAVRDFSDTNVQEPGVDESDKVKSDGSHLYVAQQDGLRIVRLGAGGTMSAVAQVPTPGAVDSLYLYQSRLVALYRPAGGEGTEWCDDVGVPVLPLAGAAVMPPCWVPAKAQIGVLIVDVQDPANPVRLSDRVFDGDLVSSRLVGGKLHLVSRFMPELPPLEYLYDGTEKGKEAVVRRNLAALEEVSLDRLLPTYERREPQGNVIERGRLVATEKFLRPTLPQGGSIVTISTFDLDVPQGTVKSVGAVLDARTVYASTSALYLAAESWGEGWSTRTNLHKFILGGEGVTYAASGSVPGSILNQFSLGEHEGVLRVATCSWSGAWGNNVYALRPSEGELEVVGRLENLAPGERLYAARFLGTRGFLVTFLQVDPLFTLDLSDPSALKVAGELKVPGFSEYIHPFGDDFLLTIGKNATPDGFFQGLQLSIFDIRDLATPSLLFREEIGDRGTWSEALYDGKAFAYWAQRGLLAIPVDLYQHQTAPATPWEYGQPTFKGVYVYRVDPASGFTPLGRIDTGGTVTTGYRWTRGLFADESVYAVTPSSIYSAQLSDIENTVTSLDIRP